MKNRNEGAIPQMPKRLRNGNYPALRTLRVLMARDVIKRRRRAGLSQAELAKKAGVPLQMLKGIESAEIMPSEKIIARIETMISVHIGLAQARAGKFVKGPDLRKDRKWIDQLEG